MAVLRQASVRALTSIESVDSLRALKERVGTEHDERVLSSLKEAVYLMESALLPHLNVPGGNSALVYGDGGG